YFFDNLNRLFSYSQSIKIQSVSDGNELSVDLEQDHPQLTKHAPNNIPNHDQAHTCSHIPPSQHAIDPRIVQLHAGPNCKRHASCRYCQETEKVDHLHE